MQTSKTFLVDSRSSGGVRVDRRSSGGVRVAQ